MFGDIEVDALGRIQQSVRETMTRVIVTDTEKIESATHSRILLVEPVFDDSTLEKRKALQPEMDIDV